MVFGKLIANGYECEDCGATAESRTTDCCDTCLLKFYFDNENASDFGDYREPDKSGMTDEAWAQTAQLAEQVGYRQGRDEVLTALAEFVGQGGSIDLTNIEAWINTYESEQN
ncbi:hypothetical protein UFOVP115_96 [uncultured Caudovirales phage]|uniref:Uncharacterized protein n=1 Tax=uncultured Caudovirales phage TaxID=2100421 RepID=A0A6J5L5W3_9CAUD|nr:hypothetical protein UFOVP115_96 [uncultured Caudovirales phage]